MNSIRCSDTRGIPVTTLVAAAALALAVLVAAAPAAAGSEERESGSPWPVAPGGQGDLNPGVERTGTLRIMRFNFDGTPLTADRGNMVGWVAEASKGNMVEKADKTTEEDTLEIVEKPGTGN
ncbi:MAG: hypothetical protein WCH13_05790 [Deltaproteobacteria bacterium]